MISKRMIRSRLMRWLRFRDSYRVKEELRDRIVLKIPG